MATNKFFELPTEASKVKTSIVVDYFPVWFSIMLQKSRSKRLGYIDLFCGPGIYKDGSKSTPVQIIEEALKSDDLCDCFCALFNDKDEENIKSLKEALEKLPNIEKIKNKIRIIQQEVGDELTKVFEEMRMIPSYVFIDPWGYKGLTLRLIEAIRKDWGCDCVFFFNYNRVNAAVSNKVLDKNVDAIFGNERAVKLRKDVYNKRKEKREEIIFNALDEAMQDRGNLVVPFRFRDEKGSRTSHYLVFISKNPLGYVKMKEIMAKHSSWWEQDVPSLEYTPVLSRRAQMVRPLWGGWGDELQESLLESFAGMTLTRKEIFDRHNIGTKYVMKSYKTALLELEKKGKIITHRSDRQKKRMDTFSESLSVTFPKKAN